MGTTPYADLPYPEGTGFVINGDDAIEALAVALDERFETYAVLERSAVQSIPNNVVTFAAWTPASSELAGDFAFGTSGANPDDILTYSGPDRWFVVTASTTWPGSATGTFELNVTVNGTLPPGAYSKVDVAAVGGAFDNQVSGVLVKLTAGDDIDLRFLQVNGSAKNTQPRLRIVGL